jgi:predicted HTH domain antitoxin
MTVGPVDLQISPEALMSGEMAIRREIALQLYGRKVFSFGQARHLANLSVWEFQQLLGEKEIPRHYDGEELNEDIAAIRSGDW